MDELNEGNLGNHFPVSLPSVRLPTISSTNHPSYFPFNLAANFSFGPQGYGSAHGYMPQIPQIPQMPQTAGAVSSMTTMGGTHPSSTGFLTVNTSFGSHQPSPSLPPRYGGSSIQSLQPPPLQSSLPSSFQAPLQSLQQVHDHAIQQAAAEMAARMSPTTPPALGSFTSSILRNSSSSSREHPFSTIQHTLQQHPPLSSSAVSLPSNEKTFTSGVPLGHLAEKCEPDSTSFPCKLCGSTFETKTEFCVHYDKHLKDAKPYVCEFCNKRFAHNSYLSQHRRIHLGIRPYKCEKCEKNFTQLSHLQQHKRVHTGERPYKCSTPGCSKAFSQLSNLQSHSRSHTGNRAFKCNSCYKAFSTNEELLDHIPKHKGSKHLKIHICAHCGMSYASQQHLNKHINQKHSAIQAPPTSTLGKVFSIKEEQSIMK